MISIEAYRVVIGGWRGCGWKLKNNSEKNVNTLRDIVKSQENNILKCQELKEYMKNTVLILIGVLVIPLILLISTKYIMFYNTFNETQEDNIQPLPLVLIKQLLASAGIEKNPGPSSGIHICEYCGRTFRRPSNLKRHVNTRHISFVNIICRFCKKSLGNYEDWKEHMLTQHKPRTARWRQSDSAFKKRVIELLYIYDIPTYLEDALGESMKKSAGRQLNYYRLLYGGIRVKFNFGALMKRENNDKTEKDISEIFFFQSRVINLNYGSFGMMKYIMDEFEYLKARVMDLDVEQEGSGWTFVSAEAFKIEIVALKTNTFGQHITFKPKNVKGNSLRAVLTNTVNVKNWDNKCVLYNIILSLYSDEIIGALDDPNNLKDHLQFIDDTNIDYPIKEKDIQLLEINNRKKLNIAINVWKYYSNEHIEPFYISRNRSKDHRDVNMLLIQNGHDEHGEVTQHLIHIKNIEGLFRKTLKTCQGRKHIFCSNCKSFKTESKMKMTRHFKQCSDNNYMKQIYPPEEDTYLPFGNIIPPPNSYKSSPPVLRGFFDFETLHTNQDKDSCVRCLDVLKTLDCKTQMSISCKHNYEKQNYTCSVLPAICFSLIFVNQMNEKIYEKNYIGEDAAKYFTELLMKKEDKLLEYIEQNKKMIMTKSDVKRFNNSTNCGVCKTVFDDTKTKCRDHDHFTGEYREALCNFCNLHKKNYSYLSTVTIYLVLIVI